MTVEKLLQPRFEIIADAPLLKNKVGEIIICTEPHGRIDLDFFFCGKAGICPDTYPHIFRKLNWWEKRTAEQMPKKVMSLADDKKDVYEIEEWDMEILVGWIDKNSRSCCSLTTFNPEYGYVPVE